MIKIDDKATWDLLCRGDTVGVFQLETQLGRAWAKKMKPRNIDDIAVLIAILRPGCLESGMAERLIKIRNKEIEPEYPHELLIPILQPTNGILVYQEQAISIVQALGDFTLVESENPRKAIGKKNTEGMAEVEKMFMDRIESNQKVSIKHGKEIFEWIKAGQRYSFNKSHSYAYAMHTYHTAFLKANHPLEFYCEWLNFSQEKINERLEIAQLVTDAKAHDINILPSSLLKRNITFTIEKNDIRFGLGYIKYLSKTGASALLKDISQLETQYGPMDNWTWPEFVILLSPILNCRSFESLILCGALDYFGKPRTAMYYEYGQFNNLNANEQKLIYQKFTENRTIGKLEIVDIITAFAKVKKDGGAASNIKRVKVLEQVVQSLKSPPYTLLDSSFDMVHHEKNLLGVEICANLLDDIDLCNIPDNCSIVNEQSPQDFIIGVVIDSVREYTIKKGENQGSKMYFVTASDSTGSVDLAAFSDIISTSGNLFIEGNSVIIYGRKNKSGKYTIDKIKQLNRIYNEIT